MLSPFYDVNHCVITTALRWKGSYDDVIIQLLKYDSTELNAIIDDNPVSYFNSSCRINHPTSLSVHICSYVMILIAKYNIFDPSTRIT